MQKFSIKSNLTLSLLAVLFVGSFFIVEQNKEDALQDHYDEKFQASQLAMETMEFIKGLRMEKGVFIDNINDPNETGIIGQEFTQITTGRGSLPIKLSATNPNFAAMVVQLLKDADVEEGDKVAVCMTGSFPAVNIATYSALKTIGAEPIIILSTTSSTWGANDPEFTWLDMEAKLHEKGIFPFRAAAASIGGNQDIGMALSKNGRVLAKMAIKRNNLPFIDGENLNMNIEKRLDLFEKHSQGKPIKAFINVGGGIASLGSKKNGERIAAGLNKELKLKNIPDKVGVLFNMAQEDVPIIHLLNLNGLMKKYALPRNPVPLPAPGEGELFLVKKYDLTIVWSISGFLLLTLTGLVLYDKKINQLGRNIIKTEK